MSVASCTILLSLVCLISLHACNARRLGHEVVMKPEELKVEEKVGVLKGDSSRVVTDSTGKLKETNKNQKGKLSPAAAAEAVRTTETLASVSWRVPRKKRGEKQPGFNLDYSPPKTHPPSHN